MKTRSSNRVCRTVVTMQSQPKRQETQPKKQAIIKRTPKSRPGVKATTDESGLSPEEAQKLEIRSKPILRGPLKVDLVSRPPQTSQVCHQETQPKKQANIKRTPKSRPGVKATTDESGLSSEEAQKLEIRRERNKAAAARCRK